MVTLPKSKNDKKIKCVYNVSISLYKIVIVIFQNELKNGIRNLKKEMPVFCWKGFYQFLKILYCIKQF